MDVNVARTCKKLSFSILDWNWYLSRVAGIFVLASEAQQILRNAGAVQWGTNALAEMLESEKKLPQLLQQVWETGA